MKVSSSKDALLKECQILSALNKRFGDQCIVRPIHEALMESSNGTMLIQGGGAIAGQWSGIVLDRGHHSLRERIIRHPLDSASAIALIQSVTDALSLLEQYGMVHMDIKPENIVLFDHGMERRWKLIDFDCAIRVGEPLGSAQVFTAAYCAPEVARMIVSACPTLAQYTMDTWALGMIALELHLGRSYWKYKSIESKADMVSHLSALSDPSMTAFIDTIRDPKIRTFLQSTLCLTGRLSASQLLKKTLFDLTADSSVTVEKMRQRDEDTGQMLRLLRSIETKVTSIGVGVDNTLGLLAVLSVDQSSALTSLSSLSSSYQTMVGGLTQLSENQTITSTDIHACVSNMQTSLSETLSTIIARTMEEGVNAQTDAFKQVLEQDRDRMTRDMLSLKQSLSRGELSQAAAKEILDRILADVQAVNAQTGQLLRLSQDLHSRHALLLSSMDKLTADMFSSQRDTKQAVLEQLIQTEARLKTGVSAVESTLQAGLKVSLPALMADLKGTVEEACSHCSHGLLSDTQTSLRTIASLLADQASSASQSVPALVTVLSTLSAMSADLSQVKATLQEMGLTLREIKITLNSHSYLLCEIIFGGYNMPALPWLVPRKPTTTLEKLTANFVVRSLLASIPPLCILSNMRLFAGRVESYVHLPGNS